MKIRSIVLAATLLITAATGVGWLYLEREIIPTLPSSAEIRDITLQSPLKVLARDGSLIAEFGEKRRIPLTYNEIPPMMINAILAAEDERYFEHPGIDATGIARAAIQYLTSGEKRQGGSTITMQMARNFFLTREKSWLRKIKELLLAVRIEQTLDKREILTLYLNKIFLGHRSYGVAAALRTYYGVTPKDATLSQFAMIAALPKAPSSINPIRNPKRAKERRDYILDRMYKLGYITADESKRAIATPLTAKIHHPPIETDAPYIAEMVRAEMVRRAGESAYSRGLTVTTTINPKMQRNSTKALRESIYAANSRQHQEELDKQKSLQGAIVALNPNSGAIRALSGGVDFTKSPFNRATQAYRQMGSIIKPLIYSAALKQGKTSATLINDAPLIFKGSNLQSNNKEQNQFKSWRPENAGLRFHGPTLLEDALVYSRNLSSIRLLREIGFKPALLQLEKFGFPPERLKEHRDLTLAIGTLTASPLEVATSYTPFANGGQLVSPYLITKIESSPQQALPGKCRLCRDRNRPYIMSRQIHYLMDKMLKKVITTGTGRAARSLKRKDIGGKTRTSNRAVDTWFAGYHPDLVTVSWIGYDQPKPLAKKESGGTTALPMWINFMENTLIDLPETTLSRPAGIISLYINPKTGRVVDNNRKPSYLDKRLFSFRQGLAPRPTLKSITGKTIGELRAEELLLY